MATPAVFSIHQDLWHDCWVAATSAVRSRRRQVDFDIQLRVARLMEEYGPQGDMPLSLRVYGTMIKGFCVLNNERARALHADCERLVFAFAQKPFGDDGKAMRLPPTKRKHADALTLDLDLAKLQDSGAFDWTQAPLEEGALLQLLPQPDAFFGASASAPPLEAPPLLAQHGDLLEVTFPALDIPMVQEPVVDLTAQPAEVIAGAATGYEGMPAEAPPQPMEAGAAEAPPPPMEAAPAPAQFTLEQLAVQHAASLRRGGVARAVIEPGRVFGFDEETTVPADVWETWWREDAAISRPRVRPAANAQLLEDAVPDRLGGLGLLIDASAASAVARRGAAERPPPRPLFLQPQPQVQEAAEMQDIPPFAAPPPDMLGGAIVPLDVVGEPKAEPEDYGAVPPGFAMDVSMLPPQPASPGGDGCQTAAHDDQTARVAEVLHHYLSSGSSRRASLDDLLPPSCTDKATAARTFHALLALATAGDLHVEQSAPYAPIAIAVA